MNKRNAVPVESRCAGRRFGSWWPLSRSKGSLLENCKKRNVRLVVCKNRKVQIGKILIDHSMPANYRVCEIKFRKPTRINSPKGITKCQSINFLNTPSICSSLWRFDQLRLWKDALNKILKVKAGFGLRDFMLVVNFWAFSSKATRLPTITSKMSRKVTSCHYLSRKATRQQAAALQHADQTAAFRSNYNKPHPANHQASGLHQILNYTTKLARSKSKSDRSALRLLAQVEPEENESICFFANAFPGSEEESESEASSPSDLGWRRRSSER